MNDEWMKIYIRVIRDQILKTFRISYSLDIIRHY